MFGALVRLLYFVADKIFSVWCETIISAPMTSAGKMSSRFCCSSDKQLESRISTYKVALCLISHFGFYPLVLCCCSSASLHSCLDAVGSASGMASSP